MVLVIINSQLDSLHNRSLSFCTNLLRTLKRNQGHLKIMRCFLHCGLLMRLQISFIGLILAEECRIQNTNEACNSDSFFKSSEPLFAMARVVSVRSCLVCHRQLHGTRSTMDDNDSQALPKRRRVLTSPQLVH